MVVELWDAFKMYLAKLRNVIAHIERIIRGRDWRSWKLGQFRGPESSSTLPIVGLFELLRRRGVWLKDTAEMITI